MEIDSDTGKATKIERISIGLPAQKEEMEGD